MVARMRKSMALLTPRFSANRTVREYTEQYYLPAAASYQERAADKGAAGKSIVDIKHGLRNKWQQINFGDVQIKNIENGYVFHVQLWLNGGNPDDVLVELYANGINGAMSERIKMEADSTADQAEKNFHA